jgi:ABC-type polysaccharide/polyol phosphate export permease
LFVALAPAAGFHVSAIDWPLLLSVVALSCFGLCALGFAVAWWLDSTAGYHVVMSVLLLPLWILSGSMFPAPKGSWIDWVQRCNPLSYAVSAVRRALYAGHSPQGSSVIHSGALELAVLLGFAALATALSVQVCYRRR